MGNHNPDLCTNKGIAIVTPCYQCSITFDIQLRNWQSYLDKPHLNPSDTSLHDSNVHYITFGSFYITDQFGPSLILFYSSLCMNFSDTLLIQNLQEITRITTGLFRTYDTLL